MGCQVVGHLGNAQQFGYDLAFAGDVNNDGYDDVIIGAPYYDGFESEDEFWDCVFNACTMDADCPDGISCVGGFCQIVCVDPGAAFVFYGSRIGFDGTSEDADIEFEGTVENGFFGYAVDGRGFANQNFFADLIIGAPGRDNNTGRAFTFFSPAEGAGGGTN